MSQAAEIRPGTPGPRWVLDPPTIFLVAVLILAFAAFAQPQFDPDFWWHLRVGLDILHSGVPQHNDYTFTANTHPFITQEWGTEALYALLYRSWGMAPVILLLAAVTWVGVVLGVLRADREGLSRWILALGAALVVISGLEVWGPTPQMFSIGFLGVLLTMLDRYRRHPSRRTLIWLVPLFIVWGNLHGGFLIGLGVIGVFLVGEALAAYLRQSGALDRRGLRDLFWALVVSTLAPMVNPNGWGLYLYPIKLLRSPVAQANLSEWQPPDFHSPANLPALLLLMTLILALPWAKKARLSELLLAGAGVVLLLYAVRDIPIFALLVLPLWTSSCQGVLEYWRSARGMALRRRVHPTPRWFAAVVLALVLVVTGLDVGAQLRSPQNQPISSAYPVQVGRAICLGPKTRVLAPYNVSGWLLYRIDHRSPAGRECADDRLFIFGEVDLMGQAVMDHYLTLAAAAPGARALLSRYQVGLVWQAEGSPLARLLGSDPAWTCVFATRSNLLYAPTGQQSKWHDPRGLCPG